MARIPLLRRDPGGRNRLWKKRIHGLQKISSGFAGFNQYVHTLTRTHHDRSANFQAVHVAYSDPVHGNYVESMTLQGNHEVV